MEFAKSLIFSHISGSVLIQSYYFDRFENY